MRLRSRHKSGVSSFLEYYNDLLRWEGLQPSDLVHEWPTELVAKVKTDFEQAFAASGLRGARCRLAANSTNQSIGNQVEFFTVQRLTQFLKEFRIEKCSGAGYPDRELSQRGSRSKLALEMKATSQWSPVDSNRRVLTSSSDKIRNHFCPPIYHLNCTVMYDISDSDDAIINAVRLDFLQPTTKVNVRLEASVNHKILSNGTHPTVTFS